MLFVGCGNIEIIKEISELNTAAFSFPNHLWTVKVLDVCSS